VALSRPTRIAIEIEHEQAIADDRVAVLLLGIDCRDLSEESVAAARPP
jgi:hypothetical protein